jgi:hypothetical protein
MTGPPAAKPPVTGSALIREQQIPTLKFRSEFIDVLENNRRIEVITIAEAVRRLALGGYEPVGITPSSTFVAYRVCRVRSTDPPGKLPRERQTISRLWGQLISVETTDGSSGKSVAAATPLKGNTRWIFRMTPLLTRKEAMARLRLKASHFSKVVNGRVKGLPKLAAVRIGRRQLFREETLNGWVAQVESLEVCKKAR